MHNRNIIVKLLNNWIKSTLLNLCIIKIFMDVIKTEQSYGLNVKLMIHTTAPGVQVVFLATSAVAKKSEARLMNE